MTKNGFAGTRQLVRLILRLDRIKLTLWLLGLLTLVGITPFSLRAIPPRIQASSSSTMRPGSPAVRIQSACAASSGMCRMRSGPAKRSRILATATGGIRRASSKTASEDELSTTPDSLAVARISRVAESVRWKSSTTRITPEASRLLS